MNIDVYTAIAKAPDNKDQLTRPQPNPAWFSGDDLQFWCFTDHDQTPRDMFCHYRPLVRRLRTPRRTARWHKLHPTEVCPAADFIIWHDGNMWLNTNPFHIVQSFMPDDKHIILFRHPQRQCVYDEWAACSKLNKDNKAVMAAQLNRYLQEGMPRNFGLFETGSFIVRNSPETAKLMDLWWDQIKIGSHRDQLSLTYVLWKHDLMHLVSVAPGPGNHNSYFGFRNHR